MPSFFILYALQAVAMYFMLSKVSTLVWWSILVVLILLYFAGKTYYNLNDTDDQKVKIFWYKTRSVVFVADVLSVIGLYLYIFLA